jgi:hypothetical protein
MKATLFCYFLCMLLLVPVLSGSATTIVKGKGGLRSEFRKTTPFTRIESRICADIQIIKSKISNIRISAQENILPLILITERDGLLIISTGEFTVCSDSSIRITIYMPCLDEISLSGKGTIRSECPVPNINLKGEGTISCAGRIRNATVDLSGTGEINLGEMKLKDAEVTIKGNGTVTINASETLHAILPGTGKLYYKGNPVITGNTSEKGGLIAVE